MCKTERRQKHEKSFGMVAHFDSGGLRCRLYVPIRHPRSEPDERTVDRTDGTAHRIGKTDRCTDGESDREPCPRDLARDNGWRHVCRSVRFARQRHERLSRIFANIDTEHSERNAPLPFSERMCGVRTPAFGHKVRYLCTRPEPSPPASFSTSWTLTRLKSPSMECFSADAATANSMASCELLPVRRE